MKHLIYLSIIFLLLVTLVIVYSSQKNEKKESSDMANEIARKRAEVKRKLEEVGKGAYYDSMTDQEIEDAYWYIFQQVQFPASEEMKLRIKALAAKYPGTFNK
ncbi:MAG: hypothetical protein MUE38_05785 [Flavihumibacter sp.]|jgi:hypothetical protein|nr:hypothetical protein [Flavihumibacter sp.]